MSQNVVTIRRMVDQLGTNQDNDQLRSKLHDLEHDTSTLAQGTREFLTRFNNLPKSENEEERRKFKILMERITREYAEVLKNFQKVQLKTAEKEKASVVRAKYEISESDKGQEQQAAMTMQQQDQLQQVDIQSLRDRQEAMAQLETDISDVNQIFKDLALMVHDQGEMLDSIEANVDNAQIHVQQGVSQIAKAAEYQRKYRRKRCFCILMLIVVAAVLALIIYLSVKT
uniref:t-SNARE coiled-coil homology domain-containing protein n=1 Tax=Romanomermis culicivorax TaxID=13658 RepID=A0A915ILJ9_ROMCU